MEVLYMLVGFSLLVAVGFLMAFFWSVKNGQYDDKFTPAVRILLDDDGSKLINAEITITDV
ncbi:MAG: cbb3-type cytochrome oxidase assembly protein CcoS [Ignavibacteria bacterium]|nr:cbb3-type cytochrome oxidase assembly protein CcoS [Ignavibacteria bacterium]